MIAMPDMEVTPYEEARPLLRPGMVAFFSQDTRGLKMLTQFASWRIKHDQQPAHECTHVGLLDVVRDRRMLIEATSPRVQVGPLSASVGPTATPDGKRVDPYDGTVYVGEFTDCDGEAAAARAWDNLLLPYDYLDLLAIRIGVRRSNTQRYICSELVAEALLAGARHCPSPPTAGPTPRLT